MGDQKVHVKRTNERGHIPLSRPGGLGVPDVIDAFAHHMMYSVAKDEHTATDFDLFHALALAARDRLMDRWFATQRRYYESDTKRVYYLSLEFLIGRLLYTNILNLGAEEAYREAMTKLGFDLDLLRECESDAALGNGGLGRLAACFLDSAATLAIPFYGYGIRYEYGTFRQKIVHGRQVEAPENWLRYGNPWEIPRPDVLFPVRFSGNVRYSRDPGRYEWVDTEDVWAMAYDVPIVGYRSDTVNSLRLWAAKSTREFDLDRFQAGQYVRAVEDKNDSENISKVLYPPDDVYAGKELRFKQQYFFVSATLQDVIRRFLKRKGREWDHFPEKVAIQLNDTHPAIAIPELMRVLMDDYEIGWEKAWGITERTFGYTNHTVLPEALESWSIDLVGRMLPRHMQIIEEIDRRIRLRIRTSLPGSEEKIQKMAIVDDATRSVRMANLAITGSHSVNGVAKLHTKILVEEVFRDFAELMPDRFNSKTNGITPRRWLLKCNPDLAAFVTEAIGEAWVTDLERLRDLEAFVDDAGFRERWMAIRRGNKVRLSKWASEVHGAAVDPDSIFDCQVKRIHEYKRQLLNLMHVVSLYLRLRRGDDIHPRTVIFAGKAAPNYRMAKNIIKIIHDVAKLVASDSATRERLRILFVPDYRVTVAERIFQACDLSEQISTAGMEASGTGNMKGTLNGALTIGTLDGANVEIRDEVGEDNIYICGHDAQQIADLRSRGDDPSHWIEGDDELGAVIDLLATIDPSATEEIQPIVDLLTRGDRYFHCADFRSYVDRQKIVEHEYRDPALWSRKSILNVARVGVFSSDRTVAAYAREIWNVEPIPIRLER